MEAIKKLLPYDANYIKKVKLIQLISLLITAREKHITGEVFLLKIIRDM